MFSLLLLLRKRQNINQVEWNSCAGVLQSTPSTKVVWSEQCWSRDNNKMVDLSLPQLQSFLYLYYCIPFKKEIKSRCVVGFIMIAYRNDPKLSDR